MSNDRVIDGREELQEIHAALGSCNGQSITLRVSDGTQRTGTLGSGIGAYWCDLPAGRQAITLCTIAGPLDRSVELPGDGRSVAIVPHGSLPHPFRYHLHTEGGSDVVVDADSARLSVGERSQFILTPTAGSPPLLSRCSIAPVPQPKPSVAGEHGCAGCASHGDSTSLVFVVVAMLGVVTRRVRR